MEIKWNEIDKRLRETKFEDLLLPTLQNTDIERISTALFERLVSAGRKSSPNKNLQISALIEDLIEDDNIIGFDSDWGRVVLQNWIVTRILKTSYAGKFRQGTKPIYVRPLTVATYRSGLPDESSISRKADLAIFRAICLTHFDHFDHNNPVENLSLASATKAVKKEAIDVLGKGITVDASDHTFPVYDEKSELDIEEILTLRFLNIFTALKKPDRNEILDDSGRVKIHQFALPGTIQPVGEDYLRLVKSYSTLKSRELIDMFLSVAAMRLFQLPFRVVSALESIKREASSPDLQGYTGPNQHLIYCDFTETDGPSQKLSKANVERDISQLFLLASHRLRIRLLHFCLTPAKKVEYDKLKPHEKIPYLLHQDRISDVDSIASATLDRVKDNLPNTAPEHDEISSRLEDGQSSFEVLNWIYYESNKQNILQSQMKWMWGTGGLRDKQRKLDSALLEGTVRHRQTWRYQPTDALLTALIATCMVERSTQISDHYRARQQMSLRELLSEFKNRFGILIDEPPPGFESVENFEAAANNSAAFRSRLQKIGCFDGLSDDSIYQPVRNPKVQL